MNLYDYYATELAKQAQRSMDMYVYLLLAPTRVPGYWEAELARRIEAAHPRHYPARARRWLSIRRRDYAERIRVAVDALRGRHDCEGY